MNYQVITKVDPDTIADMSCDKCLVFKVGEVLIVDDIGRELVGKLRKADKWGVEFEMFNDIEKAVTRAREVLIEAGSWIK